MQSAAIPYVRSELSYELFDSPLVGYQDMTAVVVQKIELLGQARHEPLVDDLAISRHTILKLAVPIPNPIT